MYRRFLNNEDYLSVISQENLNQMIRGREDRFIQAEQSAEISIIEYLSENYEIEQELNRGKYIAEYDRAISYPIGAYIYFEDKICEVIRSISSFKQPAIVAYWEENVERIDTENVKPYSQFETYYPNDIVFYNNQLFTCLAENGYKFGNIRIPLVYGWLKVEDVFEWQPTEYDLWSVVVFENRFFTLISNEDFDNNLTPLESDNWGEIAEYDSSHNNYELIEHEYIVYNGSVFFPEIDVNSDIPEIGRNLTVGDPRNFNLKKHMVRLAIYELTKLIAPNNVSVVRLKDYEDSMRWLNDASKLKLNPQIPRKLAVDNKPITDWQLATFQTEFNPHNNPWLT